MFSIRPALVLTLLFVASCSSTDAEGETPTSNPSGTTDMLTAVEPGDSMRGLRYCEVLMLNLGDDGLRAEVYNTYPLNECPADIWMGLDGGAIAAEAGIPFAILNGPRYWLMDAVDRVDDGSVITTTFTGAMGDIDMNRYAVVLLGTPDTVGQAYTPQNVDRKSRFTFRAGSTIFVLTDPTGARFVMQSWSQQRDAQLDEAGLAELGSRLQLPEGWTYSADVLQQDLVLDSTQSPAQVLQDEFMNSYSRQLD